MCRSGLIFLTTLLISSSTNLLAQEAETADVERGKARPIVFHLMEGSMVSGTLSVDTVTVTTEFGVLDVPVEKVVSFTPGLKSHPAVRKQIALLILKLGSNNQKERDDAQRTLTDMGPSVRPEVEKHAGDEDAERRTRVQKILDELTEMEEDEDLYEEGELITLISEDTLETPQFTVVGEITPKSFQVETKFGVLEVSLADIRRAIQETDEKPEVRKSIAVAGDNLVQNNLKNSGVRIARGDKVEISAEGKITMSPWGNNVFSGPDGGANFQWYIPNEIPGGALVARIGSNGKVFKVGSKHSFVSKRTGVLYLAVAMNPQYSGQGYNYPGEYTVKVKVNPK